MTLLELLIVIMMMLILMGAALASTGLFGTNYEVDGAAEQVAAQIRMARMLSINTEIRHGVYFDVDDRSFTLFKDSETTGTANIFDGDNKYDDTDDVALGTVRLPGLVRFGTSTQAYKIDSSSTFPGGAEPVTCGGAAMNDSHVVFHPRGERTASPAFNCHVYIIDDIPVDIAGSEDVPPFRAVRVSGRGGVRIFRYVRKADDRLTSANNKRWK